MSNAQRPVGHMLREWRERRRFSQLALAVEADISQRHLSFLESGRSKPSREMVLRLVEHLRIPLRARNALLVAAGLAPVYDERPLAAPELSAARDIIDRILEGHQPHPALAVDRHWTLLSANKAAAMLMASVAAHLVAANVNVLRLSLHPEGLAPRILNYREWRNHILARLAHDIEMSADGRLIALMDELKSYPVPANAAGHSGAITDRAIAIPLRLSSEAGPLQFLSTTTVFGTALDITLADVVIESFFAADEETAASMRKLVTQK